MQLDRLNPKQEMNHSQPVNHKLGCCTRFAKISLVAMVRLITCYSAELCCGKGLKRCWKEGCEGVAFKASVTETSPILIHSNGKAAYVDSEADVKQSQSQAVSTFTPTPPLSFALLIQRLQQFQNLMPSIPTKHNRYLAISTTPIAFRQKLVECAKASRPIMHGDVQVLIEDFLTYKRTYGSKVEQHLYAQMSIVQFIDRLLTKRPLEFIGKSDAAILRQKTHVDGNFEIIGTDAEKGAMVLADYLSYDEMKISALLAVSVCTPFINSGNRNNNAMPSALESFEPEGILVAMVGARFEKREVMEWQHMLVTSQQNTPENGYGAAAVSASPKRSALAMWEKFYKVDRFPSFKEIVNSNDFMATFKGYLHVKVFKERMKMIAFTLLSEANVQAACRQKEAYVVVVPLEMEAWKLCDEQEPLIKMAYQEVLQECNFPHVATIEFNGFKNTNVLSIGQNSHLEIVDAKSDPAKKLTGKHAGKLLVAQYGWNSNAYPGNEYWSGTFNSPCSAAACCSYIVPLQIPEVNPYICAANCAVFLPANAAVVK